MEKKVVSFVVVALLGLVSTVMAHDAVYNGLGLAVGQNVTDDHEDQDPWAGWVKVIDITNEGTEAWGDFHFSLSDAGYGTAGLMWDDSVNAPTSTQAFTYQISQDGLSIDLYFYGDPVLPGETASFQVYNVNPNQLSFFRVCFEPTPVPEPATIAILAIGSLALLRRK